MSKAVYAMNATKLMDPIGTDAWNAGIPMDKCSAPSVDLIEMDNRSICQMESALLNVL